MRPHSRVEHHEAVVTVVVPNRLVVEHPRVLGVEDVQVEESVSEVLRLVEFGLAANLPKNFRNLGLRVVCKRVLRSSVSKKALCCRYECIDFVFRQSLFLWTESDSNKHISKYLQLIVKF